MYVGEVSKYEKKIEILKRKSCLRENENKRILITNDLTKKERDIPGWIREETNAEKEKGNKVRIGYKKLTIKQTNMDMEQQDTPNGRTKRTNLKNSRFKKTR
jgi:hypothetical protein